MGLQVCHLLLHLRLGERDLLLLELLGVVHDRVLKL